jgi:hypothetical protein
MFSFLKPRPAVFYPPLGRWCNVPGHPMAKKDALEWKVQQKETRDRLLRCGEDPYTLTKTKEEKDDDAYMLPYIIDW